MTLKSVDENEMAHQKIETAAERWDFRREKPGQWGAGDSVASIRSNGSESAVSHAQKGCSSCPPLPMQLGPSLERSDSS